MGCFFNIPTVGLQEVAFSPAKAGCVAVGEYLPTVLGKQKRGFMGRHGRL